MSPQNRYDSNSGSIWTTAIWQGVITISSESQLTAVWLWSVSTLLTKAPILSFKKSYIAISLSALPFQQNTCSQAKFESLWILTKLNWPTHSLATRSRLLLDKLTEPRSRNSTHFMQINSVLQYYQQPATPSIITIQSSQAYILKFYFNMNFPSVSSSSR
jgi:hypothetical protein